MRLSNFNKYCAIFTVLFLVGCDKIQNDKQCYEEILAWEEWLERGMSQAVAGDGPYYVPADTVLFQSDIETNPSYGIISCFVISDSVLIISDNNLGELHAFTLDGELLWTSGQPGEGPGCLTYMGGIDAYCNVIAVCNMSLNRVDLFNMDDGSYAKSLSIQWPFDVSVAEDSTVVAVSITEEYLITMFDLQGNVLASFGNWEPPSSDGMPYSPSAGNINLKCDILGDLLVVSSVYNNCYQVYDLENRSLVSSFSREPALPLERSTSTRFILQINDCVFNNDGNIVALLCPARCHWLDGRYSDLALEDITYKGLDIFLTTGEYLGGFALQTTWDSFTVQFIENDVYVSNLEMLVKYCRVNLDE